MIGDLVYCNLSDMVLMIMTCMVVGLEKSISIPTARRQLQKLIKDKAFSTVLPQD